MPPLLRAPRFLLLAALAGCRAPTQITVHLLSDLDCDVLQNGGVSLSASSPERAESSAPLVVSRECKSNGPGNSVGTLVLVPSGEPDALVGIRAVAGVGKKAEDCAAPGYQGCIVARREVRFQENVSLVVKIDLKTECEGNPCDPRTTCVTGKECRGIEIPEGQCEGSGCGEEVLPPATGGAGGQSGAGGGEGGLSGASGQGGLSGEGGAGQAGDSGQGGGGQGGGGQGGAFCGDGKVDPQEDCDGINLNGIETCEQLSLGTSGSLSCNKNCTYNLSACSPAAGAGGGAGQGGAGQGGAGQSGGGGGGCIPKTCAELNKNCEQVDDGCGNPLNCEHKDCSMPGGCTEQGCPNDLGCGTPQYPGVCGCEPESYRCFESVLFKCNKEGSRFITQATCSNASTCDALAGKCTEPLLGSPYCDKNFLFPAGKPPEDCDAGKKICDAGWGGCRVCIPNTYDCDGSTLRYCNKEGAPEVVKDCGNEEKCHLGARLGVCPAP